MRVTLIGLLGLLVLTVLLAPLPTDAQRPGKIPRIGYLHLGAAIDHLDEAFQHGLRDLGYVAGKNLVLEYRFAAGQDERLPALAAELVQLPVDVLVTAGQGAVAAKQATATTPIVFAVFSNPLTEGLVASLARPGGNVTGQSLMGPDLAAKRLELLTELVPGLHRLAILWTATQTRFARQIHEIHAASASRGIPVDVLEVRNPPEFDGAFRTMGEQGVGAAIILDEVMFPQGAHPPRHSGGAAPATNDVRAPGLCGHWRPPVLWP